MPDKYAYYEFVNELPELETALLMLHDKFRAQRRFKAADMLLAAHSRLRAELEQLGIDTAVFATTELRRSEKASRVRPDTDGGGGARLGDNLFAEPISPAVMPGAIGVANEDKLDAVVPWWPTNEEGSDARVGGRLRGYFFDDATGDAAPPSADEFRVHPLFEPDGASPASGVGVIREPIPARYFIRDAIPAINREWHARFDGVKARFGATFDAALVTFE